MSLEEDWAIKNASAVSRRGLLEGVHLQKEAVARGQETFI